MEDQNQQNSSTQPAQSSPQLQQPVAQQSIYLEPTKGIGATTPARNPIDPALSNNYVTTNQVTFAPNGIFSKRHLILIFAVVVVVGVSLFFLLHSASAMLPGNDIATPASDFSEYTYPASYHNETVRFLYYKGSRMGNDGLGSLYGLISPVLSGGRLPLAIYFASIRKTSVGQPKCIVNSHGNSYKFSVYVPSVGAGVNVCVLGSIENSGAYIYDFEFATKQDTYVGHISLNDGTGLAGGPKDNLVHYTTDIKRIVASVQPSE